MEKSKTVKITGEKHDHLLDSSGGKDWFPPWLFQHHELVHALEEARKIGRKRLTNIINRIHFLDSSIWVQFRHTRYDEGVLFRVRPEPCLGEEITCRVVEESSEIDLHKYQFQYLVIEDGLEMILVPAEVLEAKPKFFKLLLPATSFTIGKRRARRHLCGRVTAALSQSGFIEKGELLDFNPFGFRILLNKKTGSEKDRFNRNALFFVELSQNSQIFFCGPCRWVRQGNGANKREIVLRPADEEISRFEKRIIRNPRQRLVPSPSLIFEHPFFKKRIQMEITNISTSGFLVIERAGEGILMPGMIIPELAINFAGAFNIKCSAQVIYRKEEKPDDVKCGLAILDMGVNAYSRLTNILSSALNPHTYISSKVDMDVLWKFFFDSGFIYPTKYRTIEHHRNAFRKTYEKLYGENQEIAKHFTYQRNGRIYGHIAMIRAYEKAWMIHHHAAVSTDSKRAGLIVLKQIMLYLNDMHRLPSAHMNYAMSYFQPENKFPDRAFGEFSRRLSNPKGCSMDLFAFLPYTKLSLGLDLPKGWSLKECSDEDLWELNRFYEKKSGGLLLNALNLSPDEDEIETIEEVYKNAGFFRRKKVYSLAHGNELDALLIVNQSDLGFNLSELLNCITILVINQEAMFWNVLSVAIAKLTRNYKMERVPVLFYPLEYVKQKQIPYEKLYQAWVLDVAYGNEYMEYMQKKFRIGYK
ncbi:hypothetical protein ACFL2O_01210 [Thermodesulfobacteriota bacterium]